MSVQYNRLGRSPQALRRVLDNKSHFTAFWNGGWKYLQARAKENQVTVAEMLGEYLDLWEVFISSIPLPQVQQILSMTNFAANRRLFVDLEKLERIKRPAERELAFTVRATLVSMGMMMTLAESMYQDRPSLNPLTRMDEVYMTRLMDGIERVSLTSVADYLEQAFMPPRPPAPPEIQEEKVPIEPAPTATATDEALDVSPAQDVDEGPPRLEKVLRDSRPLEANTPYIATSVYGRTYEVTLTNELIKDYEGGEKTAITRLVRSLITGKGDKSGLKLMFEMGPGIVELKAFLHGHKRIIGCLDGTRLVLKRIMDIKDTSQTYWRRIPSHLCY